ncbi:hypothetical protein [Lentzea flaviverrucosa]|uniref:Uncharacterized protein n=1 Tax=Lentzea flaviverrucosa TaxID=200379 RepID=A0A1H9B4W4_9PSEU|nr:hypothetical protein [Lentzea flaviverrucosa]RDI31884.1 hypothetical protein DFR72_103285 [Lentzea flaviverrucosa]SEP83895.1 hypothetical protein SAMN05216195_101373 [Lentzea flaviverrucosa]
MLHYLEPRTDVPAKDDWSTRLALADVRIGVRQRVESLFAAVALVVTFLVPGTPGNTAARIVLGVMVVMSLLALLPNRSVRLALRGGLLDEPWRREAAAVAREHENDPVHRLLLSGLVLKGWFHDLIPVVLDRGEVFVCGPDADGRAMVRAAGSTSMNKAVADEGHFQARDREEWVLGRPGDDEEVRDGLVLSRALVRWFWVFPAVALVVAGVLVALSISPFAPTGLVAAALVAPVLLDVPAAVEIARRQRDVARAVATAETWTSVPVRLFPWRRGHHVAGIADLPEGRALVRFPAPLYDIVANVADTGAMWVAGTHRGILAVGVPGTGQLMFAVADPDRADRTSDPMSWWRRTSPRDYSALPH